MLFMLIIVAGNTMLTIPRAVPNALHMLALLAFTTLGNGLLLFNPICR